MDVFAVGVYTVARLPVAQQNFWGPVHFGDVDRPPDCFVRRDSNQLAKFQRIIPFRYAEHILLGCSMPNLSRNDRLGID
jgi:hypothetical protein